MKHILNNLTEEEKNAIREQHTGGIKINNEKFKLMVETKLGDVKQYLSEQTQNQYRFPIDVILTDGSLILPKKMTIPRGTILSWNPQTKQGVMKVGASTITIKQEGNGEGTADSYTLIFDVNGKDYYMSWADSIFGSVYNKQYLDIAENIYRLFDSGM